MVLDKEYLDGFVCERFRTDPHYREGHIHILAPAPGTLILGLHTPEMKKIAKELAKSGTWRETLQQFADHQPLRGEGGLANEERMIWGLTIDYVKCPLEERLALIDSFLPCIDNWAICDNLCCNSAWAKKADKELLWNYLVELMYGGSDRLTTGSSERLTTSEKAWNIRVGVVLAMCHYLDETHLERTFATLNTLGLQEGETYYVRMAVAWLLATALAKDADRTRAFVQGCLLPKDIIKLYVRKARESLRTRTLPAL